MLGSGAQGVIVLSLTAGGTRPAEHPAGSRGCGRRGAAGPAPQPSCRRRLRPTGLSSLGGPGVAGVTGGGPAMGGGRTCWFSLCAKHLEIVLLSLDSGVKDFAADTARRDRAQEPRRGDPRGGTRGSSPQRPPWSPLCSRRLGGDRGPERARVARRGGGGRRIRPGTPPTRGRPAGSWFLRLLCERVCPQLDGTGIEGASQAGLALRAPRALGCGPPATLRAPGRSGPRASVSSLATRGKGHRSFPLVIGGWRETRLAWRTPSAR